MSCIPVYGTTKAYVLQFTQILQQQVEGTGVHVQLLAPGASISEGWDALEERPLIGWIQASS